MSTFTLKLVTPEKWDCEGEVRHVLARNTEGYLGILAQHAPLITVLDEGTLAFDLPDGSRREFSIRSGCLENSDNTCTVLADSIDQ